MRNDSGPVNLYPITIHASFRERLIRAARKPPSDEWKPNQHLKKRDFQEINPPRTRDEFYATYDPSVGYGTGLGLGCFICFILFKVAIRWVYKHCVKKTTCYKAVQKRRQKAEEKREKKKEEERVKRVGSFRSRGGSVSLATEKSISTLGGKKHSIAENSYEKDKDTTQTTMLYSNSNSKNDSKLREPGIHVQVIGPTPSPSQGCIVDYERERKASQPHVSPTPSPSVRQPTGYVPASDGGDKNRHWNGPTNNNIDSDLVTTATIELQPILQDGDNPQQAYPYTGYGRGVVEGYANLNGNPEPLWTARGGPKSYWSELVFPNVNQRFSISEGNLSYINCEGPYLYGFHDANTPGYPTMLADYSTRQGGGGEPFVDPPSYLESGLEGNRTSTVAGGPKAPSLHQTGVLGSGSFNSKASSGLPQLSSQNQMNSDSHFGTPLSQMSQKSQRSNHSSASDNSSTFLQLSLTPTPPAGCDSSQQQPSAIRSHSLKTSGASGHNGNVHNQPLQTVIRLNESAL